MKRIALVSGVLLAPLAAFAQSYDVSSLEGVVSAISDILNLIFPVLLAIAVFVIAWGIFKFILNAGDEEARKAGRNTIFWGVIGIFLMLSIWGLVNIFVNTFSLNNTPVTPTELLPN